MKSHNVDDLCTTHTLPTDAEIRAAMARQEHDLEVLATYHDAKQRAASQPRYLPPVLRPTEPYTAGQYRQITFAAREADFARARILEQSSDPVMYLLWSHVSCRLELDEETDAYLLDGETPEANLLTADEVRAMHAFIVQVLS